MPTASVVRRRRRPPPWTSLRSALHTKIQTAPHHEIEQDAKQPVNDSTATGASAEPDAMHKCGICGACHATALIGTLELSVFCDLPRADLAEPAITMVTLAPRVLDKPPRA